jgi:hypothetical protein
MKVYLEADKAEKIRSKRERECQEVSWPADLPLPNVGDEIDYYGSHVRIVGRHFNFEDSEATLYWRDTRYETGWSK